MRPGVVASRRSDLKGIFGYGDYKAFLNAQVERSGSRSGLRSQIARALNCQSAYLTRVVKHDAHLSLEQGFKFTKFLNLNEDETQYFLTLLQKDRAGDKDLRSYYAKSLAKQLEKRGNLARRLPQSTTEISREDRATYYSSWYYAAVHVSLSIPGHDDPHTIAKYLGLSHGIVSLALQFLTQIGLVHYNDGKYTKSKVDIHLEQSSPQIVNHHLNWRLRAADCIEEKNQNNTHYSAVMTMSQKDAVEVRERIVALLQEVGQVVRDSKEEEVYCFNTDLFCLRKN